MKYYKFLIMAFMLTIATIMLPYNKEYQVQYNTYYEENTGSLIGLSVNKNSIELSPNTFEYQLSTNEDTAKITATGSGCSVDGDIGDRPLNIGINTFKITCGSTYTLKITRTANASTDATLKNLEIEGVDISPNFSKSTLTYVASTTKSSVNIFAQATNSKAKVTGAGKITLKSGINIAIIKVTSESEQTRSYKIIITKKDAPALKNITFSQDTDFEGLDENTFEYIINVGPQTSTLKITPTLGDSTYSFEKNYGARTVSLSDGENEILVKVKKTDGKVITYTFKIVKDISSENNYLSTLKLSSGKIKFDKEKTMYKTEVLYSVKNIVIDAVAEDDGATVKVNNVKNLIVGNNTITIEVTATNKEKKVYTIIVKRLKEGETISDKAILKNIKIKDYDLKFKSNIYKYNLTIKKNTDKLNISYNKSNTTDTVTIKGNKDLKTGSKITITVTDENDNKTDYIINITKEKSIDIVFIILIIVFTLGLGLLVFVIIYMKKQSDNKLIDKKNNKIAEIEKTKEFDIEEI